MKARKTLLLAAIIGLSAFLNFFRIQANGYQDPYYATAVRSMTMSWKNFFFVAFDPGGFMSIDKPPIAFWLQTASVKMFGFANWSLIFPQALAGVLAVLVLFLVVRRQCGETAGLLAALVMAILPVNVMMSRGNNIDITLVLVTLLAAWALQRTVETGKLSWLLLSATLVGLGFNTKMVEAYFILPAFGIFYLLGSPRRWRTRVLHLAAALGVLLIVSLLWTMTVDAIPASQRPHVDSTPTNSELQLALGYNGLRYFSHTPYIPAPPKKSDPLSFQVMGDRIVGPGPLRLFDKSAAGLTVWFLPLGMLGLVALLWRKRFSLPLDPWQRAAVFWGTWLVSVFIILSGVDYIGQNYVVMLTPPIAALCGCGLVSMWHAYCFSRNCCDCASPHHGRAKAGLSFFRLKAGLGDFRMRSYDDWALPVAIAVAASAQVYVLSPYDGWRDWLPQLVIGIALIAILLLINLRKRLQDSASSLQRLRIWQKWACALGISGLVLAPLIWSGLGTFWPITGLQTGPAMSYLPLKLLFNNPRKGPTLWHLTSEQRELAGYLQAHQGHTRFLIATLEAGHSGEVGGETEQLIMATGKPIMALGGHTGIYPFLSLQDLRDQVSQGTVRYFWLPALYQFRISRSGVVSRSPRLLAGGQTLLERYSRNAVLLKWVNRSCALVPPGVWQHASSPQSAAVRDTKFIATTANRLFDCSLVGKKTRARKRTADLSLLPPRKASQHSATIEPELSR